MNFRRIAFSAVIASACAVPAMAADSSNDKQKSMSQTQTSASPSTSKKSTSAESAKNDSERTMKVLVEVEDGNKVVDFFNVEVSEIQDKAIYGRDGKKIASINTVLATANGKSAAVTADMGGFLGIGVKNVVIPVDAISFEGLRITVNLTREEIESLPEWQG